MKGVEKQYGVGLVRSIKSLWSSFEVYLCKNNGTLRFFVDNRTLKRFTIETDTHFQELIE